MKKILCFGNEFLKQDSLAKELADELEIPNYKFIKCNSVNDILESKGDLIIMDVVKDIKQVKIITDIDQLKANKLYSLHDFDLGFFLKLLKETGKIKTIKIIGIPQTGNKEKIKQEIYSQLISKK
ncbi:MAG: hypothetical protein V3V78_02830 [Candidatus Woesearchaeota archaeon]